MKLRHALAVVYQAGYGVLQMYNHLDVESK